jgi:predicted AAA+ superfamily ATPase
MSQEARISYRPRVIDAELKRALCGAGAVVVEGAKACGKTTTALQQAASAVRLDRDTAARQAGAADPNLLLTGQAPHLIDEWQLVGGVWNAARAAVDDRQAPGQFILTGSATPADDLTRHSGAMRFIRLNMRPMSLLESGDSSGAVSLADLWNGSKPSAASNGTTLEDMAVWACRGGWPATLNLDLDLVQDLNRSYLRSVTAGDIVTVDGVKRDPRKLQALIEALAKNSATYVTNRTLQRDSAAFGEAISPETISSYLDALIRLWVLVEQPAWGGHLRSAAPAKKSAKRHLVDPSLAAAAMHADPSDLLTDHEAFGQVFESLVFRDLSVYAQADDLDVRAFQDSHNNEIDAVLVRGAEWAGIEVKLTPSDTVLDEAATKILALAGRMKTKPRFLAIVTAFGSSYTRKDGVEVVAIDHLRP